MKDTLTTTDLFNIFHDDYKDVVKPHWFREFERVSGIPKEQLDDCYWQNKEIPNDEAANGKLIAYLREEVDENFGSTTNHVVRA